MIWPQALVAELAARRCIVFLGSGASAGCVSEASSQTPPTWRELLDLTMGLMDAGQDRDTVEHLLASERYLDAAEIMLDIIPRADFSTFIREQFVVPRYKHSEIHEAVLRIDPKIVITTNYDDIYDNFCRQGLARDGYVVCKYSSDNLVTHLRSPARLIIKAHGCVSDPNRIVLTRSHYFTARKNHSNFYHVLDALFVTNTLFFVGYSLSDPDVQLVLENVNIAASNSNPHYAFIPNGMHQSIERAIAKTYNINFIHCQPGDYDKMLNDLQELAEQVEHLREANPS